MLSNTLRLSVLALLFAVGSAATAHAGSIVFNPLPLVGAFPDIRTNATSITYVGGAGTVCPFAGAVAGGCLTVIGDNTKLTRYAGDAGVNITPVQLPNPSPQDIFTLYASIDSSGAFHGGQVTIVGALDAPLNVPSTTLLTGTLTDYGMIGPTADIFQFLVNVTDPLGLGFGSFAGIQISTNNVNGSNPFSADFSKTGAFGVATIDTFAQVPEPASVLLVASGAALLVLRRRAGAKHSISKV